jgi:excisionase family DNA binding protein
MRAQRVFLTTHEVATMFGVSTRTICLWAELGEIPALRAGRQWRFRRIEIERWAQASRNGFLLTGSSSDLLDTEHTATKH